MARNIGWGEPAKSNAIKLLEALLSLADGWELDDCELKAEVEVKWVSENKLRVTGKVRQKRGNREAIVEIGTTKKALAKLVEKAGKSLEFPKRQQGEGSSREDKEAEAVQTVFDCLRELGVFEEDPKNTRKNQGYWKFTLKLKHQTATLAENLAEIQLKWKEQNPEEPSPPPTNINWRDICHKMLEEQLRRYQFRRQATGTGLGHEVSIYVPLGLVKPTTQPRRGEEFCPSPDEGRLQYQLSEKEIEKRFEADAFLTQVIEAGEGKTIAIIGEPGAGKSTWLEQIARYLKKSENVSRLPICIHLGSLDGKTLEEYLLQVWLKEALSLQGMVVSAQMQTELMQLFNSRQVWLLLDGVDEIRVGTDTSRGVNSPLQGIANQLRGWVAQAQTVLTCRLNVWQANDRVVPNCDIYRTLDFDDPQVGEFIGDWFARAGKPRLGKQLREKLGESGRERIRDLIRNPLRLALLCQTWAVKQGELPKTKATLYQRFREDFYEWKPHPLLTEDLDKQNELHEALGKLAREAIEKKLPLRKRFAYKVMGKSLFKLACDVGWLNAVYKDAETDEDVYAFYHLTFQEYFAALAIDDWQCFLTHDNDNPQPLPGNIYRIFEPQWREVILLWLGREDVEGEYKEEFIKALVQFEDGCSDFYRYRAYFLAAAGIAEFGDCRLADMIVQQLVEKGFGYFSIYTQEWRTFPEQIEEEAKAALRESDRCKVRSALTNLVHTCQSHHRSSFTSKWGQKFCISDEICMKAAVILLTLFPENPEALIALNHLEHTSEDVGVQNQIWLCWNNVNDLIDQENKLFNWSTKSLQQQDRDKNLSLDVYPAFADEEYSIDSAISLEEGIKVLLRKIHAPKDAIALWQNLAELELLVLKAASQGRFLTVVITEFKTYLSNLFDADFLCKECFKILWSYYAKNISYPAFYQAWNPTCITLHPKNQETTAVGYNSSTQRPNLANLPQLLNAAIANNSTLNDTIHLICIDGSKFIDCENPTLDIYDRLMSQGFPERQNGEPETLQQMKFYWHQLRRKSDRQLVLVFYESTEEETHLGFSETFINALSTFDGAICVVCAQPCNLQTFSPSQPNLIADIVGWIRKKIVED
ncbi:NACHT domain-containing protein [Coleofasciculus sp. H7-2]|uniref:NACHT C-terminal alpha/beta 1 domain-containing protein n=1 Tax=Coleofasciculus sp. H7-2 TaxID=3351545 RepID=UPI00366D67C4